MTGVGRKYMTYKNTPTRRGAVLIVTLVLLALLAIVASVVLPQILRDRQDSRQELARVQSRQLLDDALRNAEAKREANPEFFGEMFVLDPNHQPFPGTFLITTEFVDDAFTAEVEYRNKEGKTIYTINRQSQP